MSNVIDFTKRKKELEDKKTTATSLEEIFNKKVFNNYNEVISYYTNVANLKVDIDENSYDALTYELAFYKFMAEEQNKKLLNIYNLIHQQFSIDDQVKYICTFISMLNNDTSILNKSEDEIIDNIKNIIDNQNKNKKKL